MRISIRTDFGEMAGVIGRPAPRHASRGGLFFSLLCGALEAGRPQRCRRREREAYLFLRRQAAH